MQPSRRRRPTPALVVSIIALAFAIGGTSYAALRLAPNSVGTRQIKNDAVTSAKVKDRSLQRQDFAAGQLPAGPQGPKGDMGPAGHDGAPGTNGTNGTNGTARAYAVVDGSTLAISRSKNVTAVTRQPGAPAGQYCVSVNGADARTDVAIVEPNFATDDTNAAGPDSRIAHVEWSASPPGACPGASDFYVQTLTVSGSLSATDSNGDTYEHFRANFSDEGFLIAVP